MEQLNPVVARARWMEHADPKEIFVGKPPLCGNGENVILYYPILYYLCVWAM